MVCISESHFLQSHGRYNQDHCFQRRSLGVRPIGAQYHICTDQNSFLTSPTVRVRVGTDDDVSEQYFYVHVDLLTSRSHFFANALRDYAKFDEDNKNTGSNMWREGDEGIIRLPEDEPDIFAIYVQFLYTGKLPIYEEPSKPEGLARLTRAEGEKEYPEFYASVLAAVDREYTMLAKVYVLCEKIQDVTTKRALLSAFVESTLKVRVDVSQFFPPTQPIRDIYQGTLTSDPLRAFLVDCYVYEGHIGWAYEEYHDFPHEFLYDFMVGAYKVRAGPKDRSRVKTAKYYLDKLDEPKKEIKKEAD